MRSGFDPRVASIGAALVLAGGLSSTASAEKERKIGLLLWNAQPRYQQCADAVVEQLRKEGFKEPGVTFVVENASGNKATATEMAGKLAAAHLDMVIPVGTSAAVPVAAQIKDVPVVFAFVFDPVESKIAQDWKSSGNNTTGSSSKTSTSTLLSALQQIAPVKKVAVLYTPGEKNSEVQLRELEALGKDLQISTLPVPLTSRVDVGAALSRLTGVADAMLLTGSSVVGDTLTQIVLLANKAKILTATQSEDHMEKGVLLGVTVSPVAVGRLAGEKAAKVLRGAKPASVPIEALKSSDVILNLKTAKAIGIEVPAALKRSAVRLIQ